MSIENRNCCAVVLGGYVNGYSIVRELYSFNIDDIILIEKGRSLSGYSNKIKSKIRVSNFSPNELLTSLLKIKQEYDYLIIYPTDDAQLESLLTIKKNIDQFSFIPFNDQNLLESLKKSVQYQFCEALNIPYPQTQILSSVDDFTSFKDLKYPLIIKPEKREDLKINVFRSLIIDSEEDLIYNKENLTEFMRNGLRFIVSELIPGNTNGNIYAYTAYVSKDGLLLNHWGGRKLSQWPDDYGVFSSASNEAPKEVMEQGEKLVKAMELTGIVEPEFKYDNRDGKYKLMEVNLRSMMWHRVGHLSGVFLQYSQWLEAMNKSVPSYKQTDEIIHYSYEKFELSNILFRKGYYKYFKNSIRNRPINWAVFDLKDVKPFLFDIIYIVNELIKRAVKKNHHA